MRRIIGLLLVVLLLTACEIAVSDTYTIGGADSEQELESLLEHGIIKRVIDGDTVVFQTESGAEERVRLLLIDTPESVHPSQPVQPYGMEASDYLKQLTPEGSRVALERGESEKDLYDRTLGYLWVQEDEEWVNVNQQMVREGLARVAYVIEPNTKYVESFREAEREAQTENRHIWSIEGYVTEKGFQYID